MRNLRNALVAAAAVATLGACAPATEQAALNSRERETTLVVENNNWQDMVIYVLIGSQRSRVGSVGSMSTVRFKLNSGLTGNQGQLRLLADPIGSNRTFTLPLINVVPGAQVQVRLENNIGTSTFGVF
jgi:hypothetical protein